MGIDPTVTIEDQPSPNDLRVVGDGLTRFNFGRVGGDEYRPLAVFLRDAGGAVVGGLIGATYWRWLVVEALWVREGFRGQGHGERLLSTAEEEAIRRGCTRAHVDTLSFQAPAFYRKRGYATFSELPNFVGGQPRIYLSKPLVPRSDR